MSFGRYCCACAVRIARVKNRRAPRLVFMFREDYQRKTKQRSLICAERNGPRRDVGLSDLQTQIAQAKGFRAQSVCRRSILRRGEADSQPRSEKTCGMLERTYR